MKTLSRSQYAVLNVAKAKLDLSEGAYRAILAHVAGVASATELDQDGFTAVMGFMVYLGFDPIGQRGADYGARPGMASYAQLELIRALWAEHTRRAYRGEDELNKWLMRSFKVSCLRFLTAEAARKAITALRHMKARAAA